MEVAYIAAFYAGVLDEITRLRADQWRLSYYFIVEGMGFIYLFSDSKIDRFVNFYVLIFGTILQVGCVSIYLIHLHKNHGYIGRARVVRRRLEHFFELYELKLPSGERIMPSEWKPLTLSKWFEYDIVVVPLALFVLSVDGGSLYVAISRLIELTRC